MRPKRPVSAPSPLSFLPTNSMAQAKGGRKLRRGPKHKSMYAAQFFRTAKNKAAAQTRIARRKAEKPSPGRKATRLARTSYVRPRPNINTDLQEGGEA